MSSNAVDLSRLTPPPVVEALDFEAVRGALLADLAARAPELAPALALASEPLVKLIEVVAFRELVLRARINDAALASMLATATGANLDNLAANLGVSRIAGETDTRLRQRAALAPEGWSTAGPGGAYLWHALSTPGVAHAEVSSPAPAEVRVRVLAEAGDATPALVGAVSARLSADTVRPIGDRVTVEAATRLVYPVTANLMVRAGVSEAVVRAAAESALTRLTADRRRIGRRVPRAALIGALMVEGVEDIVLTQPAADIEAAAGRAPEVGVVTVSVTPA